MLTVRSLLRREAGRWDVIFCIRSLHRIICGSGMSSGSVNKIGEVGEKKKGSYTRRRRSSIGETIDTCDERCWQDRTTLATFPLFLSHLRFLLLLRPLFFVFFSSFYFFCPIESRAHALVNLSTVPAGQDRPRRRRRRARRGVRPNHNKSNNSPNARRPQMFAPDASGWM